MRVLVACEYSCTVGWEFHKRGHDVLTCDLLPTERPEVPHHQGDVLPLLEQDWDLLIAHPPCTFLANSGVRWLYKRGMDGSQVVDPIRWQEMLRAASFYKKFLFARHIPRRCVENPIQHKHAGLPKPTQYVQPWQFGHGETKRTGLHLVNLPPLVPTNIVEGREARVHKMPPGPDRQKERSRFFPGIAQAMAEQWGDQKVPNFGGMR